MVSKRLFFLLLVAAALAFANSQSLTYSRSSGYGADGTVTSSTSLTASISSTQGSVCAGGSSNMAGGNSLSSSVSGALTSYYSCRVLQRIAGSSPPRYTQICSSSGSVNLQPTFTSSCSGGSVSVSPNIAPSYDAYNENFGPVPQAPPSTTAYTNAVSASTCTATANYPASIYRNNACCDLVQLYSGNSNYQVSGGGAYTNPSPTYTIYTAAASLSDSKTATVTVNPQVTFQDMVIGAVQLSSPPYTSGGTVSYSFTIRNPNAFAVSLSCSAPAGGTISCPASLGAGATTAASGSRTISVACGQTQGLGSTTVSYNAISPPACINRVSGSRAVSLGSVPVAACPVNKAPTVSLSCTTPITLPAVPSPTATTSCTATASDPDGPAPITYTWSAGGATPSSAGPSVSNVQSFTYTTAGAKTVWANARDGAGAWSGWVGATVVVNQLCSVFQDMVIGAVQLSSPPYTSGGTVSYSFTIRNPNAFAVSLSCSPPAGGTISCPASLAAGATTTASGSRTVSVACGQTQGLGSTTVSYNAISPPCIDRVSGWRAVSLGSVPVAACPVNNPPTLSLVCTTPITLPAVPSPTATTSCTATASDPDGPAPITYTWSAGGATPSSAGPSFSNVQSFTYTTAGAKTVWAIARDGAGAWSGWVGATVVVNELATCSVDAPSRQPFAVGRLETMTITYVPSTYAPTSAAMNWGEGAPEAMAPAGAGKYTDTHTYASAGAKTVSATITKGATTTVCTSRDVNVVGQSCTTSAVPAALAGVGSSAISVSYSNFLSPYGLAPAETITCGAYGSLTSPITCTSVLAGGFYSGTCSATCNYPGPFSEGTYANTLTSSVNGVACSNGAVTITVGPQCHDFI